MISLMLTAIEWFCAAMAALCLAITVNFHDPMLLIPMTAFGCIAACTRGLAFLRKQNAVYVRLFGENWGTSETGTAEIIIISGGQS